MKIVILTLVGRQFSIFKQLIEACEIFLDDWAVDCCQASSAKEDLMLPWPIHQEECDLHIIPEMQQIHYHTLKAKKYEFIF